MVCAYCRVLSQLFASQSVSSHFANGCDMCLFGQRSCGERCRELSDGLTFLTAKNASLCRFVCRRAAPPNLRAWPLVPPCTARSSPRAPPRWTCSWSGRTPCFSYPAQRSPSRTACKRSTIGVWRTWRPSPYQRHVWVVLCARLIEVARMIVYRAFDLRSFCCVSPEGLCLSVLFGREGRKLVGAFPE